MVGPSCLPACEGWGLLGKQRGTDPLLGKAGGGTGEGTHGECWVCEYDTGLELCFLCVSWERGVWEGPLLRFV